MRPSAFGVAVALLAGCATTTGHGGHGGHGAGQGASAAPVGAEELVAAASHWKGRCELGFAVDCRKLGRAYLNGAGVDRDDRLGAAYLMKGCEMAEPASCSDLGVLTILGRGVAQSDQGGEALTRRACEAGYALACSNLATLTLEGVNKRTPRPDDEGAWGVQIVGSFQTACDAGLLEGCLNLGTARVHGQLVKRDLQGATEAFQRACHGGMPIACHRLALLVREEPMIAAMGLDPTAPERQACQAGIATACRTPGELPGPHGALTPTSRLVADRNTYALGIPGAGGFHPIDLAPPPGRARHGRGPLPAAQLAGLPASLRTRLELAGPAAKGVAGDEPVELLVALRRMQLASCLERERSQPAAVALAATFMLDATGRPDDQRIASEPGDAGLEGCVQELIQAWSFPVPAGGGNGPHLVRFDFEAAPPGPAPGYATSGGLRAALKEPGCLERTLRLPEASRGAFNAFTIKLAIDAAGRPAYFQALTPAPEPVVAAIGAAVKACAFTPGVDEAGHPAPLWLTLTLKLEGR
jgi:TPR repeat protein